MSRKKVNERQLAILHRIAGGADPVTSREHALAVTVFALRDRGLISTTRRHGQWIAEITEAGRYFLQHGSYPDDRARDLPTSTSPKVMEPSGKAREIEAKDLIERISASGGTLTISEPSSAERAAWRRAIHAAAREKLPDGMRLQHSGRTDGDLVVGLVAEHPPKNTPEHSAPPPIAVPDRLVRPHPIVVKLRELGEKPVKRNPYGWVEPIRSDEFERLDVSRPILHRALLILHALLSEAEARGYQVGRERALQRRHVCIFINGHEYAISVREKDGLLRITLPREYSGRRLWTDGVRKPLEAKLPDLLANIEGRAAEAEQRRQERERQERERERAWERAMELARTRYIEDQRAKVLRDQVVNWRLAAEIREFCRVRTAESDDEASKGWLTWALQHADAIDPLLQPAAIPVIAEPELQALRPYLGRWNPFGPEVAAVRR